jgi:HSP20 family protein
MANKPVRWEPFNEIMNEMMSLREAMNRLLEDSFTRPGAWLLPSGSGAMGIPIDVIETNDEVIIKASVPGVRWEDLDVSVTGEMLTIKGKTKAEEKVEQGSYIRQERRYGRFERSIALPTTVMADKADARFEQGVLTLTLPKDEEVKSKTIKVRTG